MIVYIHSARSRRREVFSLTIPLRSLISTVEGSQPDYFGLSNHAGLNSFTQATLRPGVFHIFGSHGF